MCMFRIFVPSSEVYRVKLKDGRAQTGAVLEFDPRLGPRDLDEVRAP
jgi:hypothetical protein